MIYAQPSIYPGESHTHNILKDFDIQTDHGQTIRPKNNQQKREYFQGLYTLLSGGPQSRVERMRKDG